MFFATLALALTLTGATQQLPPPQAPPTTTVPAEASIPAVEESPAFDILHHILDEREVKTPFGYIHLPEAGSWMLGPIDITPTKYVVFIWLTGLLTVLLLVPAAQAAKRARERGNAPRGGHNAIEAMVLFFRDQVVMPNIGHGGEKFVPYVLTLFFFILIANLLGLVPYGGSATANISVTAALALMTLVVIELAGIRAQGIHYLNTIFYWNKDLNPVMRILMLIIMTPVEILGKLAKPFALAIRLMANMTAGKIVLYAVVGLVFVFGSWAIAVAPIMMAVALTFLKIFVAFLQAYVFALLTSVFIGLIRHAH
jgi:F-type H+-transporting ATPase subunit a